MTAPAPPASCPACRDYPGRIAIPCPDKKPGCAVAHYRVCRHDAPAPPAPILTIWKFAFSVNDTVEIPLSRGARVLRVALQKEVPHLWAVVDPSAPLEVRKFAVRGTGYPFDLDPESPYVGSFEMLDGALVFHMFEASR